MESLENKLHQIQELLKAAALPGMPTPTVPTPPAQPTTAPVAQKNPLKIAQQISDPSTKKLAVKQAKAVLKTDKNGQWSLK